MVFADGSVEDGEWEADELVENWFSIDVEGTKYVFEL